MLILAAIIAILVLNVPMVAADTTVIVFCKDVSFMEELAYCVSQTDVIHHYIFDLEGSGANYDVFKDGVRVPQASIDVVDSSICFETSGGGVFVVTKGEAEDDVVLISSPIGSPNAAESGQDVRCEVTFRDTHDHELHYRWSASGGAFDNSRSQNPIWRAPLNMTGSSRYYQIGVIAACPEGKWAGGSYIQEVLAGGDAVAITSGPTGNPDPVLLGGAVICRVTADDALGHQLSYEWSASGGAFNNPRSQNPIWRAPINKNSTTQRYEISVVATCSHGCSDSSSYFQDVLPVSDNVRIHSGPMGNPNPVSSGDVVACHVTAEDNFEHNLSYRWTATGGTFDNANIANPTWRAPANKTGKTQTFELKVVATCSEGAMASSSFAQKVLPLADELEIISGPQGSPNPVSRSGAVKCSVNLRHTADHGLVYLWWANDGSFDYTEAESPIWYPPSKAPEGLQQYDINVYVVCSGGHSVYATYTQGVLYEVTPQIPELIVEDLAPYPNQGLLGYPGASSDTCIKARIISGVQLDMTSSTCSTSITAYGIQHEAEGTWLKKIAGETILKETEPGVSWLMFVPDYEAVYVDGLPPGLKIGVLIRACDELGRQMELYKYWFLVRDDEPDNPDQTHMVDPRPQQQGDLLNVILEEGDMAGAVIEYLDTVPVQPRFGPRDELPQFGGGFDNLALNLQPPMVFDDPVKLVIPVPGAHDVRTFDIYHFEANPDSGWKKAIPGDGWLEYRENHNETNPPTVEVWLNHFTGILLAD